MRLFLAVNGILGFTLFNAVREAIRMRGYPETLVNAETIFLWALVAAGVFNAVYLVRFLISRRRRIASAAVDTAAAGVRLKRRLGSKLAAAKQQVIDRADQP